MKKLFLIISLISLLLIGCSVPRQQKVSTFSDLTRKIDDLIQNEENMIANFRTMSKENNIIYTQLEYMSFLINNSEKKYEKLNNYIKQNKFSPIQILALDRYYSNFQPVITEYLRFIKELNQLLIKSENPISLLNENINILNNYSKNVGKLHSVLINILMYDEYHTNVITF